MAISDPARTANRPGPRTPAGRRSRAPPIDSTPPELFASNALASTDRAYREVVYDLIGRHLRGIHPCGTGLVVHPRVLDPLTAAA